MRLLIPVIVLVFGELASREVVSKKVFVTILLVSIVSWVYFFAFHIKKTKSEHGGNEDKG